MISKSPTKREEQVSGEDAIVEGGGRGRGK